MKKTTITAEKKCPQCGKVENQIKKGFNASGTQRCKCEECGVVYTINPKKREYPEETKKLAMKMYYSGVSGRGVGKILEMSKANVYNWIKKTVQNLTSSCHILELDELYWFVGKKPRTKTRENTYVMTMVSRLPRQIVGFDVAFDKSPERIQAIVDNAPEAENYCSDGWTGYIDVVYPGKYTRNVHNKNDTFTVEGINADLRHYIPILARRSRCFSRKLETLQAVVAVFVDAYNQFCIAKLNFRRNKDKKSRELPFSFVDFL